jgi:hypothetical protein
MLSAADPVPVYMGPFCILSSAMVAVPLICVTVPHLLLALLCFEFAVATLHRIHSYFRPFSIVLVQQRTIG